MTDPALNRRAFLGATAVLPAGLAFARPSPPLRITLLGQALIQEDVCTPPWPGQAAIAARLARADVVFTDVETAISGRQAGVPTRTGDVLHAAPPVVLDCLKRVGVTLATTANNHAWDLGSAGILSTLAELDTRGIAHAGSGRDLDTAAAAGWQRTPHGAVALVSAAAGAIREGAAATPTRPGVNELRRTVPGTLVQEDVDRMLDAIRGARRRDATVIACLHNHYWEADPATTPDWQRKLARDCVDAGAAIFVAHGPPLLQGIELYRGAPVLHGLGSFIFQTRKASYGPQAWQSLMVEATFRNAKFAGARLTPLTLDPNRSTPSAEYVRGTPSIATGAQARDICAAVARCSAALGATLRPSGEAILL